jgi:hypothetical protein
MAAGRIRDPAMFEPPKPTLSVRVAIGLTVAALAAISGCTDSSYNGCEIATRPGERVVAGCAELVVLADAGDGYGPSKPVGSSCDGGTTYTLNNITRRLDWSSCRGPNGSLSEPWQLETGGRLLSSVEFAKLSTALDEITVAGPSNTWGVDKSTLTISVTIPNHEQLYTDVFYAFEDPTKLYVDGIDDAFMIVEGLVSTP